MQWLDRITGRVTMYRLILLALLALTVEALLLTLSGAIAYDPLAILAIGAISVAVSWTSSRLFALAFRAKPHSESSLITGLIVMFLFLPEINGAQFLAVALAALLANASKYLLAIRRRHIFNPAALGAFVTGLILPQNPATWWIGTPWMLPLVAVSSFVILYRTRHLTIGVVAIIVAAGSAVAQQLAFGTMFGAAVAGAFLSYPIVFFVGFMFSEPLTLPPRRWQQLIEAVIVGALFGIIFDFGALRSSFQLALLVGNLLAFLVGQRRGIRLEYLGRTQLSSNSFELSFRPATPVRFRAGQFMELTVPHAKADARGVRRTFSIASAPDSETVAFGIRTAKRSSTFKKALLGLETGDTVMATAVGGDFVLPNDPKKPLLLIAGGIGITPFVSHVAEVEARGGHRDIALVYAGTAADDLAYAETLQTHGHPVYLVAPEPPGSLPPHWSYLGRGPLTADMLLASIPDARERVAYVSGPPGLVHPLKRALRRAHVRGVKSDYFSGY